MRESPFTRRGTPRQSLRPRDRPRSSHNNRHDSPYRDYHHSVEPESVASTSQAREYYADDEGLNQPDYGDEYGTYEEDNQMGLDNPMDPVGPEAREKEPQDQGEDASSE
jgi:hypothetical protein